MPEHPPAGHVALRYPRITVFLPLSRKTSMGQLFRGSTWTCEGCARERLDKSASEIGTEVIDHRDDHVDGEDQREEAMLQEEADGDLDLLAASPADVTQDDRLSDIDLPPVVGVGDKLR